MKWPHVASCVMTLHSIVSGYQRFRRTHYLHFWVLYMVSHDTRPKYKSSVPTNPQMLYRHMTIKKKKRYKKLLHELLISPYYFLHIRQH